MTLDAAPRLTQFCSRAAAQVDENTVFSLPTGSEIAAMENAIAGPLDALITDDNIRAVLRDDDPRGFGTHRSHWVRQYIAYTREGRRFLFGNFIPKNLFEMLSEPPRKTSFDPTRNKFDGCDVGPQFWSAEFEPTTRKVRLSFGDGWGATWPTDDALRRKARKAGSGQL